MSHSDGDTVLLFIIPKGSISNPKEKQQFQQNSVKSQYSTLCNDLKQNVGTLKYQSDLRTGTERLKEFMNIINYTRKKVLGHWKVWFFLCLWCKEKNSISSEADKCLFLFWYKIYKNQMKKLPILIIWIDRYVLKIAMQIIQLYPATSVS